jgi:glycosyltransferase involved in cell wall biosynthesis
MPPVVSVIIPARNASKYIGEAVESAKKQSFAKKTEIIVVDDGSSDGCGGQAAALGCKVIKIPFAGAPKARNEGIKNSSGEYLLFHDADDILEENAVVNMYKEFEADSGLQAVFAMRKDFISPELSADEKKELRPGQEPYFGAIAGCALIKKSVFALTGLFDESLYAGDAVSWQMVLREKNIKTKQIQAVAVRRRLHLENFGRVSKALERKDYAALLRKKLLAKAEK